MIGFALVAGCCEVAQAQSGSFIIPTIRANGGTDFAYWDLFARPPGATANVNFQFPNPPARADGTGEDLEGNRTTAFAPRAVLTQTGTPTAFVTSSGAIYSFSAPTVFEASYTAPTNRAGEVTNVVFQSMTGGARLDVTTVRLRYVDGGGTTVEVQPVFRALDDPQTGAFSERIISAFQWNLTGRNVRTFQVVFGGLTTMPLWEAQLDVVVGGSFVQELGYLLTTRARPATRFGRPGAVNTNLGPTVDGRFFLEGEVLNLTGEPATGWETTGWFYDGAVTTGGALPLVFPARDITVTALFAPTTYQVWRQAMFLRANTLLGTADDFSNDAVSAPSVDHDGDGLSNAGEHAFAGDPYTTDTVRTRPQMLRVEVNGQHHAAIRYRSNGLASGVGDVTQRAQVSVGGGAWRENAAGQPVVTVLVGRELQPDGSMLVTERMAEPLGSFSSAAMRVAWSVGGMEGSPLVPQGLSITREAVLAAGRVGSAAGVSLSAEGGLAPYRWQRTLGELPPGVVLEEEGSFSGRPTTVGSYEFTAEVTDALGARQTRVFSWSIGAYEITTEAALGVASLGNGFERALTVAGGSPVFDWQLKSGALPPGLTLSAAGVIAGTPTQAGQYSFEVEVTDGNGLKTAKALSLLVVNLRIVNAATLPEAVANAVYPVVLEARDGALPYAWSVTAGELPPGMTLTAAGSFSGRPLQAGTFQFTVAVTDNDGSQVTRAFTMEVLTGFRRPVVTTAHLGSTTVGAEFAGQVAAANLPQRFAVTGLPRGLRLNAATGLVSGRAEVAGWHAIQVQAFNAAGGSAVVTVPLLVRALPPARVGSFVGLVQPTTGGPLALGAGWTLTTTTGGAFSLQLRTATGASSLRGFLRASAPHLEGTVAGAAVSLSLDEASGLWRGTVGAALATGWKAHWDARVRPAMDHDGRYTVALRLARTADQGQAAIPQGHGFALVTVTTAGSVRYAGRTGDGQALTMTSVLGRGGQAGVFGVLHRGRGAVVGETVVAADPEGDFSGNTVTGRWHWTKQAVSGRDYAAGFGPVEVAVEGGYLGPVRVGGPVLGLPDEGAFDLRFLDGGLADSDTDPDLVGAVWSRGLRVQVPALNPGSVSLQLNAVTGALSGRFTLVQNSIAPPVVRGPIPFSGLVVRLPGGSVKAVGHFLLPQLPASGQTLRTTAVLSGAVELRQMATP